MRLNAAQVGVRLPVLVETLRAPFSCVIMRVDTRRVAVQSGAGGAWGGAELRRTQEELGRF